MYIVIYVVRIFFMIVCEYRDHNTIQTLSTVKPPNKGHFGTSHFVLYREVVLLQRSKMY